MRNKKFLLYLFIIYFVVLSFSTPKALSLKTSSQDTNYIIYIDINTFTLTLINKDNYKFEKVYPVAIGKPTTPSPLGTWQITSKALMAGPYGGYWLGLNAPWDTFGIHGTNRPGSIGTQASGGCIRMYNTDIKELFELVEYGTSVIITGGPNWRFSSYNRVIKPNSRGSDVYLVQMKLKSLGYFHSEPNGIYEYSLQLAVRNYREENDLPGGLDIDGKFLDKIGLWKFE
ncbi:L,D-transpeptidase family protein [Clostridium carnis]